MSLCKPGALPCLLLLCLAPFFVQAAALPSVLSFGGGGDANGSRDQYLDLDAGLVGDGRLLLSLARNRSAGQDNPITTDTALLGLRTDPLADLSVGVDLERWGEEDRLIADTLRVVAEFNLRYWQVSLRPQWRTLTFTTDCVALLLPRCNAEEEVKSRGLGLDVSYFTEGPWSFSLGLARHEYDREIQALAQYPVFELIFSAATLDLSAGLEERRSSLGVSYFSDGHLWSVSWLKSVSAVTGDATLIGTLRFSTDLSAHWRLRLNLGSQGLEGSNERVGFAGAGLAYSW